MKIAILSDVHANLEALEAVLSAAQAQGAEAYVCLGDLVGYGPDPRPCLDLIRNTCTHVVLGNHDLAVASEEGMKWLPKDGQEAARLHRTLLTPDELDYLRRLPLTAEAYGCTFVHATPGQPQQWQRIESPLRAREQFAHFDTALCFLGHTHVPGVMAERIGVLQVRPGHRYLINVGSVGQPRDGDPRACLGLLDLDPLSYRLLRVPYDVDRTASKIKQCRLPLSLSQRLYRGR